MNRQPAASYRPRNIALWAFTPGQPREMNVKYFGRLFTQRSVNPAWEGTFIPVTPRVMKLQCVSHFCGFCTSVTLTFSASSHLKRKDVSGGNAKTLKTKKAGSGAHSSGLVGRPPALKHRTQRLMWCCQPPFFPARNLISLCEELLSCSPRGCSPALK